MDTNASARDRVESVLVYLKCYVGPALVNLEVCDITEAPMHSLQATLSCLDSELRLAHQQVWQAAQEVNDVLGLVPDPGQAEPMSVAPLSSTSDGAVVSVSGSDHTPSDE